MLPDRVSNPGPLTYESGALPIAHNRQLRSVGNDMLSIPGTKTSYYDRSFTVDGAKQWNELPINIKNSPSLLSFKNSIKAYLLLS